MPQFVVDATFIATILAVVAVQLYRYRWVSNARERRQTKWVVYGTSISLVGFISAALLFVTLPPLYESVIANVSLTFLLALLISAIPVCIAIALLRARLWDIDLIINRTLVYGVMTAIVAGLLAVLSDLAKGVFLALTGRATELAPMVATLMIVALFDPIRKRVQGFVDRHFKYATGTFGEFAEELARYVQMNDADELARRFLKEALATFDARGGAVYLGQGAEQRVVSTVGTWDGQAGMSAPLEYGGKNWGMVELGPALNGDPYDDAERASLKNMSALVARAIQVAHPVLLDGNTAQSPA
jgi:hypothetical protein